MHIRQGAGIARTDADELGRFAAAALQAGPMSLRVSAADDGTPAAVITDWLAI